MNEKDKQADQSGGTSRSNVKQIKINKAVAEMSLRARCYRRVLILKLTVP